MTSIIDKLKNIVGIETTLQLDNDIKDHEHKDNETDNNDKGNEEITTMGYHCKYPKASVNGYITLLRNNKFEHKKKEWLVWFPEG
jgi:hypothetical protein